MSNVITRYNLTYRNDFNEVYQADRDEDSEGEFVLYEDHAAIVAALTARPTQPTTSSVPDGWKISHRGPGIIDVMRPFRAPSMCVALKDGTLSEAILYELANDLLAAAPAPDLTEHSFTCICDACCKAAPDLTERAADLGVRDADSSEVRQAVRKVMKHHGLALDGVVEADLAHAVYDALRSQPKG